VPRDGNAEALRDPGVADQLSDGDPAAWVHLQEVVQQVHRVYAQPLGHRKPTRLDLAVDDRHVVGRVVERQTAAQQGVEQDSHAPHIHLDTASKHLNHRRIV